MWAEVNGERKKVACGPCIRGHRSSKCDHRDRVLVEVRKPGRPLSSCPHPSGTCSCERIVINYTIPKSSECACPSQRTATISGTSRVQKQRRKSTTVNATLIEKVVQLDRDTETDASSVTQAPTEGSGSHEATPQSSASSTPQLLPIQNGSISGCCKPTPTLPALETCSSVKAKEAPEPELLRISSCCSGPKEPLSPSRLDTSGTYQQPIQHSLYDFQPLTLPHASVPFRLSAPIYNHAAAAYQHSASSVAIPLVNGPVSSQLESPSMSQHTPEHNCHCGDSCSCFGCAAHPNNATMMEYVRLMAEFQYTGGLGTFSAPLYDMPTYPHHPGYGAEANPPPPFHPSLDGMSSPASPHMAYSGSIDMSIPLPTSSLAEAKHWPQLSMSAAVVPGSCLLKAVDCASSDSVLGQASSETRGPLVTSAVDVACEGGEADTPTLSPSSYFWNEMVLPGCNDATGTCQCGDGCECVGCLTHEGHNGVVLQSSLTDEHNAFLGFDAVDDALDADGANELVNMNMASA